MDSRWKVLVLLVVARLGLGFQFQTTGSSSESLLAEFGLDYTTLGTLIGLFMLTGLFTALPAGWIGRYWSDRTLACAGLLLLSAGGFVASAADAVWQIGLGRIICGAGFVLATIYFTKMTTDWFAGREIATALGLLVMTWPLSIAAGQIFHTWASARWNWSVPLIVASIFCLLGAVLIFALYREPGDGKASAPSGAKPGLSRREYGLIIVASLAWALFNAGYIVYLSFAPAWLVESGLGVLQAASIASVASWLMMLSGALCGWVSDRTGKPDLILYGCVASAVVAMLMFYYTDLALLACIVFGLLGAAPAGVIMALTSEAMQPANRAVGMGLFFSSYFLFVAPAPMIAGWLVDRSDSNWPALLFAAALFAATGASYAAFRLVQRSMTNVQNSVD